MKPRLLMLLLVLAGLFVGCNSGEGTPPEDEIASASPPASPSNASASGDPVTVKANRPPQGESSGASEPANPGSSAVHVETLAEQPVQRTADKDVTIAILGFNDRGPSVKLAPLRHAVAEMLGSDLAQLQGIRVVERGRVDQFLSELDLGQTGVVESETAQRAGEVLLADYLIVGDFSGLDKRVTLTAALHKTEDSKPLGQWKLSADESALFDLEAALTKRVLAVLGFDNPTPRPPAESKPGDSPLVAVLPLRNHSGDAELDAVQVGLSEMLQANLSALPDVRLVERQEIDRVLSEQNLTAAGLVSPEQAVQIGKLLGAERLVYGSYLALGQNVRIDLRITDVETASLVTAVSATGPTAELPAHLESLTVELARGLTLASPQQVQEFVRAGVPKRSMEGFMHAVSAGPALRDGRFADALRDVERVLLTDPDNFQSHRIRVIALRELGEIERAIAAGQQALARKFPPSQKDIKTYIAYELAMCYWARDQYDEFIALAEQSLREYPESDYADMWRTSLALAYLRTNRGDQGEAIFEELIKKGETSGDQELYASALRELYQFHRRAMDYIEGSREFRAQRSGLRYMAGVAARTHKHARSALELYDKILESAKGKRDDAWKSFGAANVVYAPEVRQFDISGRSRRLLTDEKLEEYCLKGLDVFGWIPDVGFQVHDRLAPLRIRLQKWTEAEESYRYVLEHPEYAPREWLPSFWDIDRYGPTRRTDNRIEARYQIALIQRDHHHDPEAALEEFQTILRDYGAAHHRAQETVAAVKELGGNLEFPEKAVLVWGGGGDGHEAFDLILNPMGYTVHSVSQYQVNASHLAPYDLVILVRSGNLPYQPTDLLALRQYLATGGAALCVVSPGWELAATSIHNPLLAFFDARAEGEVQRLANSTRIAPHPITEGIDKVFAKSAVHLAVPEQTALIEAKDTTIVAAMPYRYGKVVLSSFGQWLLPVYGIYGPHPVHNSSHWTARLGKSWHPQESGPGLQLPLLKNALAWLLAPEGADGDSVEQRARFTEAHLAGLRYQFQLATWEEMMQAMDQLVDGAASDIWKEEALWAAGEASRYAMYFPTGGQSNQDYGYGDAVLPEPEVRYYAKLVEQFPGSPLVHYAQWRLADCERFRHGTRYGLRYESNVALIDARKIIAAFEQVQAPEGSYAWAWTKFALAQTYMQDDGLNFNEALPLLLQIVERMAGGPEKSFALYTAASCYAGLGNKEEARRYYELVLAANELQTWDDMADQWQPLGSDGRKDHGSLHWWAKRQLSALK